MHLDKINKLKELTEQLNHYRDLYYNNSESLISDKQYDDLFDELQSLEEETGIVMSNSPTKTVGYEVKSKLKKVKHLKFSGEVLPKITEKLENGKQVFDAELRSALRTYNTTSKEEQ